METKQTQMTIKMPIILMIVIALLSSCSDKTNSVASFSGEAEAVNLADSMFQAIGGKQAWCELQSLYIKAEHTEPPMTQSYQSEIWRAMDELDIIIEQQNDSFHVRAEFTKESGVVTYLDDRDSFRTIPKEQIEVWDFRNSHNIYVALHKLACEPASYKAMLEEGYLSFYQDSVWFCKMGLDEELRPFMFFVPELNGKIHGSIFTHWGTDKGLVHSDGGHPLDSSFVYRTKEWIPSNLPLRESFNLASDD